MTITATKPPSTIDTENLALPFYEPRHVEFAHRIADWCEHNADLWRERAVDPERTGRRILRALGQDGFFSFMTDADPDFRSLCLARQTLAYAEDLADYAFSIQTLSAAPIRWYGSAAQRARYLPALADGTACGAFAV